MKPASASYLLGKSYFDLKEFRRAAHALKPTVIEENPVFATEEPIVTDDKTSQFLYFYSLYLAGEKTKNEEFLESGERTPAQNRELKTIIEGLQSAYMSPTSLTFTVLERHNSNLN